MSAEKQMGATQLSDSVGPATPTRLSEPTAAGHDPARPNEAAASGLAGHTTLTECRQPESAARCSPAEPFDPHPSGRELGRRYEVATIQKQISAHSPAKVPGVKVQELRPFGG